VSTCRFDQKNALAEVALDLIMVDANVTAVDHFDATALVLGDQGIFLNT